MKSASFHSQLIKENLFAYILMAFRLLLTNPGAIVHLYKNLAKRGACLMMRGICGIIVYRS